jgi:ferredoxin-NADP reductase
MTPTNNPSEWVLATVREIRDETPTVKTFTFEFPRTVDHKPGQHYEIRLTAPDGYQAARLYSAASAANGTSMLQLTIALLEAGELSPYMHKHVKIGDQLELRGPLGRFFVWEPTMPEPIILVAGGSGIVPMRCILQAHAQARSAVLVTVLYSSATQEEIIYSDELLAAHSPVIITLTQEQPAGWQGKTGRINSLLLQDVLHRLPSGTQPTWYVCGSTPFVEAIADALIMLDVPADHIKAERFGGEDLPLA